VVREKAVERRTSTMMKKILEVGRKRRQMKSCMNGGAQMDELERSIAESLSRSTSFKHK